MAKAQLIARQSSYPQGLMGHVVARVMSLDTARANRRVIEVLAPRSGERVLEVGCGHGRTLARVAALTAPAQTWGVDPSEVMRRVARGRNRRAIAAEQVCVDEGDAAHLPFGEDRFDKVFSVHTLYFWPDLGAGLREIRRVLRDGGELLLAHHSHDNERVRAKVPTNIYTLRTFSELAAALEAAGFSSVRSEVDSKSGLGMTRAIA